MSSVFNRSNERVPRVRKFETIKEARLTFGDRWTRHVRWLKITNDHGDIHHRIDVSDRGVSYRSHEYYRESEQEAELEFRRQTRQGLGTKKFIKI